MVCLRAPRENNNNSLKGHPRDFGRGYKYIRVRRLYTYRVHTTQHIVNDGWEWARFVASFEKKKKKISFSRFSGLYVHSFHAMYRIHFQYHLRNKNDIVWHCRIVSHHSAPNFSTSTKEKGKNKNKTKKKKRHDGGTQKIERRRKTCHACGFVLCGMCHLLCSAQKNGLKEGGGGV